LRNGFFGRKTMPAHFNSLFQGLWGDDLVLAQLKQSLKDQGQSQNRAQNQRPDGPSSGLNDGQQNSSFFGRPSVKTASLWMMVSASGSPRAPSQRAPHRLNGLWITLCKSFAGAVFFYIYEF
jgi:hypothetical protein